MEHSDEELELHDKCYHNYRDTQAVGRVRGCSLGPHALFLQVQSHF